MPARFDAKAVFRVIGPRAKAHPDLVKKVAAAGHRLCDHSTDHDTSTDKKPVACRQAQILDAKKPIEEAAGGAEVQYYRAPGGAFTPDRRRTVIALDPVLAWLKEQGRSTGFPVRTAPATS